MQAVGGDQIIVQFGTPMHYELDWIARFSTLPSRRHHLLLIFELACFTFSPKLQPLAAQTNQQIDWPMSLGQPSGSNTPDAGWPRSYFAASVR